MPTKQREVMSWIEVPVVSKKGESLDNHIINLNSVLYFREWKENIAITEGNNGKTVAFVIGGKDVIINMPLHEVYGLIKDEGEEIRDIKVLKGDKETDTKEA